MTDKIQAFTMPKWGIEMEEGVIREWHADIGDQVTEGDVFVVIETDKIANEVEIEYSSTMRRRIAQEGDTYPVGALIAVFADNSVAEDKIEDFVKRFKAVDASFANAGADPVAEEAPAPSTKAAVIPENTSISPLAKNLAMELGVDLSQISGSGRRGRISLQDVEQAAKAQGLFPEVSGDDDNGDKNPHEVIKLSAMRKTIAKRLTQAIQTIPHFYLRVQIDMDPVMSLREIDGKKYSVNDYIIKACAKALQDVPDVNVNFVGDEIHKFKHADISVAVSTERGLITPVIRSADTKSVAEISSVIKELAQKAKDEKLQPSDYQGGTFSVSNLGMYGIQNFDAVINPPMGAILAVGAAQKTPASGGGDTVMMLVTLSCDHRVIDGALGAQYLQAFKAALENPEKL